MNFRTRILLASLAVALLPLLLFGLLARQEVRQNLGGQFRSRVDATSELVRQDLARQAAAIDARLRGLARALSDDAVQRASLLGLIDREPLANYAADVMGAAGLDYLLVLDSAGTVLSSGHMPREHGRTVAAMPRLLDADGPVLVEAYRDGGSFRSLVRALAFTVSGRRFVVAGGVEADSAFMQGLAQHEDVTVTLARADEPRPGEENALLERMTLPYLDDVAHSSTVTEARLTIAHSTAPLLQLQRRMDGWLLFMTGVAAVIAFFIARVLATRITRPLEELAAQSTRVNLDHVDIGFALDREDELGTLSRLLDGMVQRLRKNAHELRAAERRATMGDMARQVNHDIRNGLLPLRNVISHLAEVAHAQPAELPAVFKERESTLQSGIGYLENLASNYARLTPRTERTVCDVNATIRAVLDGTVASDARVQLQLSDQPARVSCDPVALRRVIENLTINAMESLENGRGGVTVSTEVSKGAGSGRIYIRVSDTGRGIEPGRLDRIFDDFYTTKARGTGLGLSIVRRLVADMGGRIRVSSTVGQGTTFDIELPEAA